LTTLASTLKRADVVRQLDADLPRLFPSIVTSQSALVVRVHRILRALSNAYPLIGYVQGMDCVCAFAALHCSSDADVFAMTRVLTVHYLRNYFYDGFPGSRADALVLEYYVQRKCPRIAHVFSRTYGAYHLIVTNWCSRLFVNVLPRRCVARVWDHLLCFGPSVLITMALRLLVVCEQYVCDSFEECMEAWPSELERMFDFDALLASTHAQLHDISHAMVTLRRAEAQHRITKLHVV